LKKITFAEKLGFGLNNLGAGIWMSFINTFLLYFYTNVAHIRPAVASLIISLAVIWDAVNDALFGVIFDSVSFKSGKKYLPWLKISTVLIPITTVLLFGLPGNMTNENLILTWIGIAYILWDTAYTLCDVPIFGIITAMSNNLEERTSLMSYKSIWSGAGSGVSLILGTVLVHEGVGSSYFVVSIICAVIALFAMIPASFKLNERYVPEKEEDFSLKKMFSYLIKNKYLLIYYVGYLFYSGANVQAALNLIASYFLFKNSAFSLIASVCSLLPSLIFSLLVPSMIKKMDKMKIFEICCILSIIFSLVCWLAGYSNVVLFFILFTLRSIPLAVMGVMLFMFTPDCAEFGKYTTGVEAKGITFSIQTFVVKLSAAFSTVLGTFILGLKFVGWNPLVKFNELGEQIPVSNFEEIKELGIVQTPHALNVLWFVYIMLPAIGFLIAFLIWRAYKLNDKDVQVMIEFNSGVIDRQTAESRMSRHYKLSMNVQNDFEKT